jgi:hypothetical protein
MNKPVSFKIAKLLSEKGFDCEFRYFYTKPNSKMFGIDEHGRSYPIKNTPKKLYIVGDYVVLNIENVYPAPTTAEVIMWLYEKYSIWLLALPTITGNFAYKIVDVQLNPEKPIERPPYKDVSANDYKSPTEAYENAIEYCLNNLIDK